MIKKNEPVAEVAEAVNQPKKNHRPHRRGRKQNQQCQGDCVNCATCNQPVEEPNSLCAKLDDNKARVSAPGKGIQVGINVGNKNIGNIKVMSGQSDKIVEELVADGFIQDQETGLWIKPEIDGMVEVKENIFKRFIDWIVSLWNRIF